MSQSPVRKLFNLTESEFIYDQFQCKLGSVLHKKLGCLFCCENHFCYYSNVMGITVKEIIPLAHVKSIKLSKDSIIIDTYKNKKYNFGGLGTEKNRAFSLMYSIYSGEFFDNSSSARKKQEELDINVPENQGQKYQDGVGVVNLTLVKGLDKTVTDFAKLLIPCEKEEINMAVFDKIAQFPIKSYYTQLGYSDVHMENWDKPDNQYERNRVISYVTNFAN